MLHERYAASPPLLVELTQINLKCFFLLISFCIFAQNQEKHSKIEDLWILTRK